MPFIEIEGSETVSTTEWDLITDSSGPDATELNAVWSVLLDLNALAAGDEFLLQGYCSTTSGGTQRVFYSQRFVGAQGVPLFLTPSWRLKYKVSFTLDKIAGTDRAITWIVYQTTA